MERNDSIGECLKMDRPDQWTGERGLALFSSEMKQVSQDPPPRQCRMQSLIVALPPPSRYCKGLRNVTGLCLRARDTCLTMLT